MFKTNLLSMLLCIGMAAQAAAADSAVDYNNRGNDNQAKGDLDGAIADYNRAIKLDPKNGYAYNNRGNVKKARGDSDGAIADYYRAIKLSPKDAWPCNDLAWLLATSSVSSVRNGSMAVEYAQKACELSDWKDVAVDTLAAAYAESGDFDQALKWEIKYTKANPSDKHAQERLALYQKHQPYHEASK